MNVYRFRSMEYLLGDKYQELERKTIYFASPDQLNDPMEGFRDIVWSGDKIVWTNFFKHYVYCLHATYLRLRITGDSAELHGINIPIQGEWNYLLSPNGHRLFNDVWDRFLSLPYIRKIIEALSNSNRKIRYTELRYYLQMIHTFFLPEMIEIYIKHHLTPESERPVLPEELSVPVIFKSILTSIKLFDETRTEEEINVVLQQIAMIQYGSRLGRQKITQQYKHLIPTKAYWNNHCLVFDDFPMVYLKEIEKLLWPEWYTACFTKYYHNSSVWGHYADSHKGVCLIFESNDLELYDGAGSSVRKIPLSEIKYVDKPAEVDFFTSISRLTVKDVKDWYTDEEGNTSECGSHIPREGDMDSDEMVDWRNRQWAAFYRDITVKTEDWKYEEEYRLVLEDGLSEFKEGESRALKYDFSSLKGIIFGIKTSDDHRLKIIEIIQKKCEEYSRTDFRFYQAKYSPEDGGIRKYEIPLLQLGRIDRSDGQAN